MSARTDGAAPPLTIGVPVYNGEDYLDHALASIARQTFTDFRVVVGDNASTDATPDIASSWAARDDRFVHVRHAENIGGARNADYLLDRSESPWFKWAYYDDVLAPELLERSFEAIGQSPPDTVLACPRVLLVDPDDQVVGEHADGDLHMDQDLPHERLRVVLSRVVGQVQFGVMRTAVGRQAGGVGVSLGSEMVLPASIALRGRIVMVPGQLFSVRVHPARHGGDRASELAWVDPSRPRVAFPYSRSVPLLLRAVLRARLGSAETTRCLLTTVRCEARPGLRALAGDVVRLPRDLGLVGRRPLPAGADGAP